MPGYTSHCTSNEGKFIEGGKTHMFGKQTAGPQQPGVTQHQVGGSGGKFIDGGSTKMYGEGHAKPQKPGTSASQH
jgi:hypothetical protein